MEFDELINRFRLASREMFNHYFRVNNPYENDGWLQEERFRSVEEALFAMLVAEPFSIPKRPYGEIQENIQVTIHDIESVPVMINREINSGYWDYPIEEISRDAKLKFISFFDWDRLGIRDNHYVRAAIADWPLQPETNGKHILIEHKFVKFLIV